MGREAGPLDPTFSSIGKPAGLCHWLPLKFRTPDEADPSNLKYSDDFWVAAKLRVG